MRWQPLRVGSFFDETRNGLHRGVIRDVPPEQTPSRVLVQRTRRESGDLFAEEDALETTTDLATATIMEVLQWLARREPRLAAMQSDEPVPAAEPAQQPTRCAEWQVPLEPPPRQQRLF